MRIIVFVAVLMCTSAVYGQAPIGELPVGGLQVTAANQQYPESSKWNIYLPSVRLTPGFFLCHQANTLDFNAVNDDDHVVCIIGSQRWTNNGFSNYTNAIWLLERGGFEFRTTTGPNQAERRMTLNHVEMKVLVPLKVQATGGNVPHSFYEVVAFGSGYGAVGSCAQGDFVLDIQPSCDNGAVRNSRRQGWSAGEITCTDQGSANRITLTCARF